MFSVTGKRILLTGGARGVGQVVSRVLVDRGAKVAILDVLDEQGKKHAETITSTGPGRASYFRCNIAKRSEVFDTVKAAVEGPLEGSLDAVHNIAGVERSGNLEDCTEEDFDLLFNVNVKGSFFIAQAAFPYLKAGGGGSIINYGSDAGQLGSAPLGVYGASKGAIHSLTRAMANNWARYNIRTNTVIPAVKTPMYDQHLSQMTESERAMHHEMMKTAVPLGGQLGNVEELAPMMVYLTSDSAKFVTGQIFSVNGGIAMVR